MKDNLKPKWWYYFIPQLLGVAIILPILAGVTVDKHIKNQNPKYKLEQKLTSENHNLFSMCMEKASGEDGVLQDIEKSSLIKRLGYNGAILDGEAVGAEISSEGVKFYFGTIINPKSVVGIGNNFFYGNDVRNTFLATPESMKKYLKE